MRSRWMWLSLVLVLVMPAAAQPPRGELSLSYSRMRANAPVGGCGCFSLNGGNAAATWNASPRLGLVGEFGATHASGILLNYQDLTVVSYLFGPRLYLLSREKAERKRISPFAQVLLGGAHASGLLAGVNNDSSNSFAFKAGGGLDVAIRRRVALRAFQAEYFHTRFPNGVNDHQNILLLSAGVVFRFGK